MTLSDLYANNNPNNKNLPQKFWGRYEYLNRLQVPGDKMIAQEQLKFAQYIQDAKIWNEISQHLQQDYNGLNIGDEFDLLRHIQNIENAFSWDQGLGSLYRKTGELNADIIRNNLSKYYNLLNQLEQIYIRFIDYAKNPAKEDAGSKTIAPALIRLEYAIEELKQDIVNLNPDVTVYRGKGYLKNMSWIGNQLKGFLLEIEGVEALKEMVPRNFRVVNTAALHVPTQDIFGNLSESLKQSKSDIMIFNIADNINISFTIGKENGEKMTMSLTDFFDFLEKNKDREVVYVNADQYKNVIREKLVTGIQAKSGYSDYRFNTVSLDQILGNSGSGNICKALNDLMHLVYSQNAKIMSNNGWIGSLKETHNDYDMMFNFLLSKHLTGIIGKENNIMLTRNGFMSTRQFLIEAFKRGKYIKVLQHINLKEGGKKIQVGMENPGI